MKKYLLIFLLIIPSLTYGQGNIGVKGGINNGAVGNPTIIVPTIVSTTPCFQGGSTSSATCNIGVATAGQVIMAAVGTDASGAGGSLSITDNCNTAGSSNTYTQLTNSPLLGNVNSIFGIYARSTIGATTSNCTLTFTETVTTGDFSIAVILVSNATTVEQSQLNYQAAPGTATDAITSTATGATAHVDLVVGFYLNVQNGGAAIPTAGTGFTIQQTNVNGPIATESLKQTSKGTATATFTTTTPSTGGGGFAGVVCFH